MKTTKLTPGQSEYLSRLEVNKTYTWNTLPRHGYCKGVFISALVKAGAVEQTENQPTGRKKYPFQTFRRRTAEEIIQFLTTK